MESTQRVTYLNGLRGILAVIVFIHHFFYLFCPDFIFGGSYEAFQTGKWTMSRIIAYSPLNILYNPGMAINFFFLLSGYVQSFHYFKTQDLVFIQRSFLKRYFRLVLPTLAVVILVFICHQTKLINKNFFPYNSLSADWIKSMMPDNLGFFAAFKYGFTCFFNGNSAYYQVLWTMPIELYNSLMVLIMLMVTHRLKNSLPLFLLWLLIQIFLLQSFYSVSFTIGLMIARLDVQSEKFKSVFSSRLLKWIFLVVGLYFSSYPFTGYELASNLSLYRLISFFDTFPHVISYVIGNTLLFIVIINATTVKNIFSRPILLLLGNISFMFYLIHFLVLFTFSGWCYQSLVPYLISSANITITGFLSFVLITLISYVLNKYIDVPVVKYCNVYTHKLFGV